MAPASASGPSNALTVSFATELVRAVTSRNVTTAHAVGIAIREDAERIARENAADLADPATARWLTLAAVALACYRHLLSAVGDRARALAILESALTQRFETAVKTFVADRFGISEDSPAEAFDRIAENFKPRGEERFGPRFTFVSDPADEGRSLTRITRCLFHDVCTANGAPELTRIFCAIDLVWAEELSHPRYGVRFERRTTLAAGDDACRFEFSRVLA